MDTQSCGAESQAFHSVAMNLLNEDLLNTYFVAGSAKSLKEFILSPCPTGLLRNDKTPREK